MIPHPPLPATTKWHRLWVLPTPITFVVQIKVLYNKESNLLRNEKWWVCQNINKFISGVDGCKDGDEVAKCESCLWGVTVNDAFNAAATLLSFTDNKWKNLYTEEHTRKPFASDELKHFQEAEERVKAIYKELQKVSNKLTTCTFASREEKEKTKERWKQ